MRSFGQIIGATDHGVRAVLLPPWTAATADAVGEIVASTSGLWTAGNPATAAAAMLASAMDHGDIEGAAVMIGAMLSMSDDLLATVQALPGWGKLPPVRAEYDRLYARHRASMIVSRKQRKRRRSESLAEGEGLMAIEAENMRRAR